MTKFQNPMVKVHLSTCHFRIEREIDDVVDIMKDNIDKTMQRGDRLDDLQDKSGTVLK